MQTCQLIPQILENTFNQARAILLDTQGGKVTSIINTEQAMDVLRSNEETTITVCSLRRMVTLNTENVGGA